jgi:hypothetical protein
MNVSKLLEHIIYSSIHAVSPRGRGRKYDTGASPESGRENWQFVPAL